jgi:hypothetical protein
MSSPWFIHDMLNNNNDHKSAFTEGHSHPGPPRRAIPSVRPSVQTVSIEEVYTTLLYEILTGNGDSCQLHIKCNIA